MNLEIIDDNALETKATDIVAIAKSLKIVGQEAYDQALGILKDIKAMKKEITDFLAPQKEAAHKAHAAIVAAEKSKIAPLDDAEKALKNSCTAWATEQEKIRAEEARKAEEARQLALAEQAAINDALGIPDEPMMVPEVQEPEKLAGTFRKVWKFRIDDPAAIPREYLMIDEKKIGEVVRSMNEATSIPGVTVYAEKSMVNR